MAEEIVEQLKQPLPLPNPAEFADLEALSPIGEYLTREYGETWIGTRAVKAGVVLHHGDIPQEAREILEALVRDQSVKLVVCTSTLAEGVNLPIRTLVLYSVQRRQMSGD